MKKILPICYPMSATHSHVAHCVSILQSEEYTYDWLMNCFIQLQGGIRQFIEYQDFWILDCPILRCQRIGLDLIEDEWKESVEFIKFAIEHDYYVYAMVDASHIKSYGGRNFMHDIMIYGYDDLDHTLNIADFFQGRKYDFSTASYSEIRRAFQCREKVKNGKWIFYDDLILLKPRFDSKAVFEPGKVRNSIEAYLKGKPLVNTFQRIRNYTPLKEKDYVFGVNCYQILHRYINYVEENNNTLDNWIHVFHIMYEHKKIMEKRLIYMKENSYIEDVDEYIRVYSELAQSMLLARNLFLKYNYSKNRNIMKNITRIVNEVESREMDILPDIINKIIPIENAYDVPPIYC